MNPETMRSRIEKAIVKYEEGQRKPRRTFRFGKMRLHGARMPLKKEYMRGLMDEYGAREREHNDNRI
jgi:hypothetical protein